MKSNKRNQTNEGISVCSVSKSDSIRIEFLNSLRKDLQITGYQINVSEDSDQFLSIFPAGLLLNKSLLEIGDIYKSIKQRELLSEHEFICEMENSGILRQFINGDQLNPFAIKTKLVICRSSTEFRLVKYCRLYQSVPNSLGVGRRFSVLVYDIGQEVSPVLMGLMCFADATVSLRDRDNFLDWTERSKKKQGLKMVLQLSVCMALPPYHLLFGAKLIAGLALSTPIQNEFNYRYNLPLLAVIILELRYHLRELKLPPKFIKQIGKGYGVRW